MTEQELLETENSYWDCMDEETKDLCQKTIEEVKRLTSRDSKVSLLSDISTEIREKICENEGVIINKTLLDQAITPMALAKYLQIASDSMKIGEKVKHDLGMMLDSKRFDWFVSKNFDNLVVISKVMEINSDEKPKSLSLKYKYDYENDLITYSLLGQSWNWEISKDILVAILNDKLLPPSKEANIEKNNTSVINSPIELSIGDIVISIKSK